MLQDKYKELTDAATASGVSNLQVREQDGVLYINGDACIVLKISAPPSLCLCFCFYDYHGRGNV